MEFKKTFLILCFQFILNTFSEHWKRIISDLFCWNTCQGKGMQPMVCEASEGIIFPSFYLLTGLCNPEGKKIRDFTIWTHVLSTSWLPPLPASPSVIFLIGRSNFLQFHDFHASLYLSMSKTHSPSKPSSNITSSEKSDISHLSS